MYWYNQFIKPLLIMKFKEKINENWICATEWETATDLTLLKSVIL